MLNYFAGACAPCTAEMPGFETAYESSAGKVLIVGLDVGPFTGLGSHEDAARLLRQLAIRYPAAYAVDDSALRTATASMPCPRRCSSTPLVGSSTVQTAL